MKFVKLKPNSLLLAQIVFHIVVSSSLSDFDGESDEDVQEEESSKQQQQQQGSWSRWWSYDGISGPDYWNINKRWHLCSSGRKQSPVDLSTKLLIHDHLLGSIELDWLPAVASIEEAEREIARKRQPLSASSSNAQSARKDSNSNSNNSNDDDVNANEDDARHSKLGADFQRPTIRAQLLNSGRGFEVWFEGGHSADRSSRLNKDAAQMDQQRAELDQLILTGGPLSYAYKLFKLELHSSLSNRAGVGRSHSSSKVATTGSERAYLDESQPEALDREGNGVSDRSSEHRIDGRSFDAELQMHFYNKHLANSANQALSMADEGMTSSSNLFAVVSVFIIQTSVADNDGSTNNGNGNSNSNSITSTSNKLAAGPLDFLLNNVQNITKEADMIELELTRRQIDRLVPDRAQYVTYQGSMNRPPCSESVDWILTNKPLRVDVDKFQNLFASSLKTTQDNIRPIKPLYKRLLRTTINQLSTKTSVESVDATQNVESEAKCRDPLATNCSRSSDRQRQVKAGRRWQSTLKEQQQEDPNKCSMKPRYAYQLSDPFKEL